MKHGTPGPDTTRELRDALGRFATGVCVVTTLSDRGPLGITANSFASVSLDPPLVLWSPARASRRFDAFAEARRFAIHILADDQVDLARQFTSDGLNFEGITVEAGADGVPLIDGCLARFDCTRDAAHDGGDHLIIVGRVDRMAFRTGSPLVFSSGRYGTFGSAI